MILEISGRQRSLLYEIAIERLTDIDALWHAVKAQNWSKAHELGQEYGAILQLLTDGLGWGEDASNGTELKCSSDVLKRALRVIRREAEVDVEEQQDMRMAVQAEAERREIFEVCDRLLDDGGD